MILEDIVLLSPTQAKDRFRRAATRAGFLLAGVAPAAPLEHYPIYNQWVADGLHGPMAYLADHRAALRLDPRALLPSARSVLSLGMLYNSAGPNPHSVSRYAWGAADYHDVLRAALQQVLDDLYQQLGPFDARLAVDTAPLLERSLAHAAGLGWIGRNTCLINEPLGSWFFLGEILTSLDLPPDQPAPDRCGSCRRCLDACPTQALIETSNGRARLDARLCISTWTIEQRGPLTPAQQNLSGHHIFGCDICQEVCPWNRRAPLSSHPAFQPQHPNPDLEDLASLTEDDFRLRFRATPLWRAKYKGLLRNLASAMGNSGNRNHLPSLRRLAQSDDPATAQHAARALANLEAAR